MIDFLKTTLAVPNLLSRIIGIGDSQFGFQSDVTHLYSQYSYTSSFLDICTVIYFTTCIPNILFKYRKVRDCMKGIEKLEIRHNSTSALKGSKKSDGLQKGTCTQLFYWSILSPPSNRAFPDAANSNSPFFLQLLKSRAVKQKVPQ